MGHGISAIVRIRTTHAQIKQCLSAFDAMPEIVEAHRITGEDCFMVRMVVAEMTQLEMAIDALARFGPSRPRSCWRAIHRNDPWLSTLTGYLAVPYALVSPVSSS